MKIRSRSRHSLRAVPTKLSTNAFAWETRVGVLVTLMPSAGRRHRGQARHAGAAKRSFIPPPLGPVLAGARKVPQWTSACRCERRSERSSSAPRKCPQARPGHSSEAAAWHGAAHNGENACYAGLYLRAAPCPRRPDRGSEHEGHFATATAGAGGPGHAHGRRSPGSPRSARGRWPCSGWLTSQWAGSARLPTPSRTGATPHSSTPPAGFTQPNLGSRFGSRTGPISTLPGSSRPMSHDT